MQNNTFSTLFIGQNFIKLKEVDSTNDYLKNITSKSEPLTDGTVIMADSQTAGRGQQGNIWYAEPRKNISASIYLKLKFLPINRQFYLNMVVSCAVAQVLSELLEHRIEVKWPNDIYFKQKKIGGILIENVLTGSVIKSSVIGIGVNINQLKFSTEIDKSATSMQIIGAKEFDIEEVLGKILQKIEHLYFILKSGKYSILHKDYLLMLYNYNKKARYLINGYIFDGTIEDVSEHGQLMLRVDDELKYYNFKEIEFLHS